MAAVAGRCATLTGVATSWVGVCRPELRFAGEGGSLFWLLPGGRDGGADEVECFALGAGQLGQHRHGGRRAGEADLVSGQGGEVVEEAAEAAVGPGVFIVL